MTAIFRLQLFKLKKSTTFWVFLGLCVVLPLLGMLLVLGLFNIISGEVDLSDFAGATSVTSSLMSFASFDTYSTIFAIICSSIVLSREFSQGTVRNAILANKSRLQLFVAYVATALFIGAAYFVANFVSALVFYGSIFGFGTLSAGSAVSAVLCCFAMGLGSMLFSESLVCVFLFGTRKQSATIAWPLVICLVGTSILASIIDTVLLSVQLNGYTISETLMKCLPFYNLNYLGDTTPDGLVCGMTILYDVVFSVGFLATGFVSLKHADLK